MKSITQFPMISWKKCRMMSIGLKIGWVISPVKLIRSVMRWLSLNLRLGHWKIRSSDYSYVWILLDRYAWIFCMFDGFLLYINDELILGIAASIRMICRRWDLWGCSLFCWAGLLKLESLRVAFAWLWRSNSSCCNLNWPCCQSCSALCWLPEWASGKRLTGFSDHLPWD